MYARRVLRRAAGLSLLTSAALGIALLSAPVVASATGTIFWVNNAVPTVAGDGSNCSNPGFATVQSAVNAAEVQANATIEICPGTYVEQVQITGHTNLTIESAYAHSGVVIQLPTTPVNSTTSCDTANGTQAYQPDQDGFAVCGTSATNVSVSGITFNEAWPANTCDDSLYGILVGGHSTLKLTNSTVVAGGAVPINGCQGGIGIQVGMAWTTPNEAGHATLSNDVISGYQKNGVTVDGKGSTASFWKDTVEGAGATTQTAQNGIQVSNGAYAVITRTTIEGNECNNATCGANALSDYQATGVLFYGAKKGSTVTQSTIIDNDIGVYYASEQPTLPSTTEVWVTADQLQNNRYEGVVLDQGRAVVDQSKILGGNVGVMVLQYDGQAYGSNDRVTATTIKHNVVAAIDVLSDQAPTGDLPGSITFTNCPISGPVLSNTSSITVTIHR